MREKNSQKQKKEKRCPLSHTLRKGQGERQGEPFQPENRLGRQDRKLNKVPPGKRAERTLGTFSKEKGARAKMEQLQPLQFRGDIHRRGNMQKVKETKNTAWTVLGRPGGSPQGRGHKISGKT